MKILIIQDFLRSGGTERQSILLANAFAAAGHATCLATFRPGGALAGTVTAEVARRTLQPFDFRLDWFAPGLISVVRDVAPDVVLCMGRMANCHAGMVQARMPGTLVVATMRTGKTLPIRFRRSLATVHHVIANSHDARNTLVDTYSIPAAKISVIHNALIFPPESFDPVANAAERDRLRARHGATPHTTVLLCVAMFRPEKNQRELIEIVSGLPADADWQLWLAGAGPTRAACEHLRAVKQLERRVEFVGFHRDPSSLYRAADLAVHASRSEALSNFLIEAQAHGVPAIAYEAQGIGECFVPDRTGWIIPRHDRAAFQAALTHRFADSPSARAAIAAAARAYARETFDPGRQAASYLALFRDLLAAAGKG
jgi:glycosyltransferase involved in cell wall biosynthesis